MTFQRHLQESLKLLERELPSAYRQMCLVFKGKLARICVDDECIVVESIGHELRVVRSEGARSVVVQCTTSRKTLLALLDADLTIVQAVRADQLWLQGSVTELLTFYEALASYFHGSVRCRSFPALLQRYRNAAQPSEVSR